MPGAPGAGEVEFGMEEAGFEAKVVGDARLRPQPRPKERFFLFGGPKVRNRVPIPGTKRVRYLEENVGALAVTLSAAELARLAAAFPPRAATGERYSARSMKSIDR
jgi:hypothetical protein